MLLRHIHLPNLTPYAHASLLQDRFVSRLLAYKANPSTASAPDPVIITAEFSPVYTCGRREIGTVSAQHRQYLTAPAQWGRAEWHEALRGGQTTFHGPGQLVAYPVVDLRRHRLSARCYIHALESAVMKTCAQYGVSTQRTANPGVWVDDNRKICALGVHLRRNVSSHGIGLNVHTELGWFERIVACGLEGKSTTTLAHESLNVVGGVEEVATVFAGCLVDELEGVDGILKMSEEDVD